MRTLIPVGVEVMVSPLRPVTETVTVTFVGGGGGGAAAFTVSTAVRVRPLRVAEIVTEVVDDTLDVVTGKPQFVDPAPTVTLDGTLATAGLLLDNATVVPPAGAAPDRDTMPDVPSPPFTLGGLITTLFRTTPPPGGVIVSVAERVSPL